MKQNFYRLAPALLLLPLFGSTVYADDLVETYIARLSAQDHFNSQGERLTSAAAIIRQDRANFHKFNNKDSEDTYDTVFSDVDSRATLEHLLEQGRSTRGVLDTIVNGTPLIQVDVYWNSVDVTILEE